MVKCPSPKCGKTALFNWDGETKGVFCSSCCPPGMVNVVHPRCVHIGCRVYPFFNIPGEKKGLYCSEHKKDGMTNVIPYGKICPVCLDEKKKKTRAYYNFRGQKNGIYCSTHKAEGMVNVKDELCQWEQEVCNTRALFNFKGQKKGLYCETHAHGKGMVNVKSPKCEKCRESIAIYNFPHQKKGRFCKDCKLDDMVDVHHKKCLEPNCKNNPSYNFPDETGYIYCSEHAKEGMIDLKHRKCHCGQTATFGFYGGKPERCGQHIADYMIDLRHKQCETCIELLHNNPQPTVASYGLPGHQATHCKKHMSEGMIINPRTKCKSKGCKEYAQFGIVKPLHCIVHASLSDEQNLVGRRCENCKLVDILDEKGRCDTCRPETVSKFRLGKQRELKLYLEANGMGNFDIYDRMIDGGVCGRERPDFVWKCAYHYLVLECDENGHRDRNQECERTRMINISQSFGMPTVFIRYNPDAYTDHHGKQRNPRIGTRIKLLMKALKHFETAMPEHFLSVSYLYFDGFNPSTPVISEAILEFEK